MTSRTGELEARATGASLRNTYTVADCDDALAQLAGLLGDPDHGMAPRTEAIVRFAADRLRAIRQRHMEAHNGST